MGKYLNNMHRFLPILIALCGYQISYADTLHIYLIPGTGADARLFSKLDLPPQYCLHHIEYTTPEEGMNMNQYARALAVQIDTTEEYFILGVSLGGMLAIEMNTFLKPEKTILISSAKTIHELPGGYRFQRKFPIYKLIGPKLAKWGSQIAQPIFEHDRKEEKETFKSMLKAKDPLFLDRAIAMTMSWDRLSAPFENVYHIHGEKDHTIPIRNVNADYIVDKGSHLITLTRAADVSDILCEILSL